MTDLQASLIVIGGSIVVGVISYNKWQEYKARKTVEKAFSSEPDDVLMAADVPAARTDDQRHEPVLEESASLAWATSELAESEPAAPMAPAPQRELPVDELIDCIIPIALEAPLRGDRILPRLQGLRHIGKKPVHFIGQREDGGWEEVAQGGIYYGLKAGVQLASRASALNEIEYSELITCLRQMADELDAEPDVPDMADVMAQARSVHQFVSEYDAQLSVNVKSNGEAWAVNTLMAALERQGFDLRPDGRLVMPDGDGGILFSVSTNVTLAEENTSCLTLLLDVPRVAPLRDGFGAMIACARVLAGRLGGTVVDDSGQALSDAALDEIAGQVSAFYDNMEAAGVPAGSSRALRLFA